MGICIQTRTIIIKAGIYEDRDNRWISTGEEYLSTNGIEIIKA